MANLKIKSESTSTRCEICHKSDLFNPTTNFCKRCGDIVISSQKPSNRPINFAQPPTRPRTPISVLVRNYGKAFATFTLAGLVGGLLFDTVINIESFETFWFYADYSRSYNFPSFIPTWKYYFFAGLIFQFSVWLSYSASRLRKWVVFDVNNTTRCRWLAVLALQIGFFCLQTLHANEAVTFFFLPVTLGLIIIVGLKLLTKKLFNTNAFVFIFLVNFSSYLLFPFLLWLQRSYDIDLYYGGLGAFYTVLFGLGVLFANENQIENQQLMQETSRAVAGEVS